MGKNITFRRTYNPPYHLKINDRHDTPSFYLKNKDTSSIDDRKIRYYLKNKETISERKKQYHLKNKETVNERNRRYHLKNKETISERKKLYHLKNKETINEQKRQYYLKKFPSRKKKKTWKNPKQVRQFFESARAQLYVSEAIDWYRISRSQISNVGGRGLYSSFGNLGKALQYAYPEFVWDQSKFSFRGKKSVQRWLRVILERILPKKTEILEDFLHPDLLWDENTKQKMELDIWVPKYNLALEYQGEQHYYDLHCAYGPHGTVALYTERDLKKKKTCSEKSITLAVIPYWWDGRQESLASTLYHIRPDIFPKTDAPPVTTYPSNTTKKDSNLVVKNIFKTFSSPSIVLDHRIITFLMHGQEWNGEQDPTGWFISEKLDGYRAFWDGSKLFSKQGKIFPVPLEFTRTLPRDVYLDGELWVGYDGFSKLFSIFKNTSHNLQNDPQKVSELWQDVKFCVFDAPMHPGHYPERHSLASDSISGCGPNIYVIPIERCLGLKHLQTMLHDVTTKKGEGIMLYHPASTYTSGRTSNLLKVKAYAEEDVKFLQCNPNSYTYICEQLNGATCFVKCSGWDYTNPPSPGTVLTVKHNGFFKTSQKMKYPFLLRIRTDLGMK